MDVLKPDIVVIEGIRYRINPGRHKYGCDLSTERYEETFYDQFDDTPACDALSDGDEDVEEIEGGRYKVSFHVAKSYFPYIIGTKGATKKRLETETRSKIVIPKQGQDGNIVISAATKKNVLSARRRIRMMVQSSRKRRAPTHFISIPLNKPSIINGFLDFKAAVLEKFGNDCGISERLFQNPEKLHLTIAMLALSDEIERNEAAAALEDCKENFISPLLQSKKLRIEMSGIEIMNDDPSSVNVLYGKVKFYNDENLLQDIADGIYIFYSDRGMLVRERNHVKLHCTLMNANFSESYEEPTETATLTKGFDATNIVKHFKDYYFGEETIPTIELSMLHSSSENEYYKASSSISIP